MGYVSSNSDGESRKLFGVSNGVVISVGELEKEWKAVSYTHLDVYKRQRYNSVANIRLRPLNIQRF